MKKIYRISAINQTTKERELAYAQFSSRKYAQEIVDKMNELNSKLEAQVLYQEK